MITGEQLQKALEDQKIRKKMLGDTLVENGSVSRDALNEVLCELLNISFADLKNMTLDQKIVNLVDENTMRKFKVVPVGFYEGDFNMLQVAMADPMDINAINEIEIITGKQVQPMLANLPDINIYLDKLFGKSQTQELLSKFKTQQQNNSLVTEAEAAEDAARREEVENSPIVLLVNKMIENAVRERTSDIHIEPMETYIRVRYRIDGALREMARYDVSMLNAMIARLKIMSNMDISEKRKPQDGRITIMVDGGEWDIRVSNLPTCYGEKVVMRLASKTGFKREKSALGMLPDDLTKFDNILKNPNGIILVTGPTGSGKSTTLYTALSELNKEDVNIITVEDPVEANIDGINQVMVNVKAEMTFANALRSILRQDPDIIMIGEIRDTETAEIAVRASITGHLVVSTLHTNSTASTVTRLIDMGIEPYMIADSLVGVIAQRLVRRLCPNCKKEHLVTMEEKRELQLRPDKEYKIYEPAGCEDCGGSGYRGRIGIYEIMTVSNRLKSIIGHGGDVDKIKEAAIADGMTTLRAAARRYVLDGTTSFSEMVRVTYEVE
ncbi:MAG: Flp pilus assembly complex ATPase component TadA [Lachnospiraceae bacterium]|nr:Flp pilus assembly complex ATPase component TadA [Lachnospiraceae bacterium]